MSSFSPVGTDCSSISLRPVVETSSKRPDQTVVGDAALRNRTSRNSVSREDWRRSLRRRLSSWRRSGIEAHLSCHSGATSQQREKADSPPSRSRATLHTNPTLVRTWFADRPSSNRWFARFGVSCPMTPFLCHWAGRRETAARRNADPATPVRVGIVTRCRRRLQSRCRRRLRLPSRPRRRHRNARPRRAARALLPVRPDRGRSPSSGSRA